MNGFASSVLVTHINFVFLLIHFQLEFAVKMSCLSCVDKIQEQLSNNGISKSNISISYENSTVTVITDQPSSIILNSIEKTGFRAVLKGYGSATRKTCSF